MKRWVKISGFVIGGVLLLAAGFVGGAYWTSRFWLTWMDKQFILVETNSTFIGVEILSRIRLEEYVAAVELLELKMDGAVISMSTNRLYDELPQETQKALQWAKVYFNMYPPKSVMARNQLEEVPMPEVKPSTCGASLYRLVTQASEQP